MPYFRSFALNTRLWNNKTIDGKALNYPETTAEEDNPHGSPVHKYDPSFSIHLTFFSSLNTRSYLSYATPYSFWPRYNFSPSPITHSLHQNPSTEVGR